MPSVWRSLQNRAEYLSIFPHWRYRPRETGHCPEEELIPMRNAWTPIRLDSQRSMMHRRVRPRFVRRKSVIDDQFVSRLQVSNLACVSVRWCDRDIPVSSTLLYAPNNNRKEDVFSCLFNSFFGPRPRSLENIFEKRRPRNEDDGETRDKEIRNHES